MLGERVRAERERKDWSQYELARRAGVSQSAVAKIESGARQRPSGDILQKLAAALDTTVDALLGGHTEAPLDLRVPPVELFRAAGWSDDVIAELVATWDAQLARDRLKIVTRAQKRIQQAQAIADARQADEDELRREIGGLALIL